MCWATEPSTPPAKRSRSKRLSSDYASDYQRLSGTHRLIASRRESVQKPNKKPLGNAARMWLASGRVLLGLPGRFLGGCRCSLRDGIMRTIPQGTPYGHRARGNALTLPDVCVIQKPLITPFRGIVSGAAYSAGASGTVQAYPQRARTGAGGARGCRAYIRTGARLCGTLGGSWGGLGRPVAIGHRKAPDGSGAGII